MSMIDELRQRTAVMMSSSDQQVANAIQERFGYQLLPLPAHESSSSGIADSAAAAATTFASRQPDEESLGAELRDIGLMLIDLGFDVELTPVALLVAPGDGGTRTAIVPGRGEQQAGAAEAAVRPEYIEEVYWAHFYAHHVLGDGSTFYEYLVGRPDLAPTVIDIGCGDGRDSWAFARSGRRVVGLDRSEVGVRHARERAEASEHSETLRFLAADVADRVAVDAALKSAQEIAGDEPLLYYLRFFLHSIPEDVQATLMNALADSARPGDMLAAEFRTEEDAVNHKVYGKHYRRFQNGKAFGRSLEDSYGFDLVDEAEGTGLSPYGDEDPYLYRVVARRR